MRVLIVEDDEQLNAQLKQFLEEAGYSVDTACDGRDGLFMGSEYPYDVAVVDLGLPITISDVDMVLREEFTKNFGVPKGRTTEK